MLRAAGNEGLDLGSLLHKLTAKIQSIPAVETGTDGMNYDANVNHDYDDEDAYDNGFHNNSNNQNNNEDNKNENEKDDDEDEDYDYDGNSYNKGCLLTLFLEDAPEDKVLVGILSVINEIIKNDSTHTLKNSDTASQYANEPN